MTTDQLKRRVRETRKALKQAICTCSPGKHDPFWMQCPKALAAWYFHDALATLRSRLQQERKP